MNVGCMEGFVLERQIFCRTGILGHLAGKTQIESSPNGGIDTHVAHGTANKKVADVALFQDIKKRCVAETVGIVFHDDGFVCQGNDLLIDFRPTGVGQEKGCPLVSGDVLDMDDVGFFFPKCFQEHPGVGRSGTDAG